MATRARKAKFEQLRLFNAVESNHILLDLLEMATTDERKTIFIESLLETLPTGTAFARFDKDPVDLFLIFTTWFGKCDQTLFYGISAAIDHRHKYFLDNRNLKRDFISDIGLDWTEEDKKSSLSKVNFLYGVVMKS